MLVQSSLQVVCHAGVQDSISFVGQKVDIILFHALTAFLGVEFAEAFLLSERVLRDCHVASLLAMTNRRCVPFYDGSFRTAVPSRDCHVALLLAMTHQAGAAAHQCPSAVELPCTRRSLSAAAFFSRTADLYGSPQPTENIQNLAIRARTVHFYATRICDSSQLVKHYFFEKGIDSFLICVILFL